MDVSPLSFDVSSVTHAGKVRSRNEDSHLVRTDAGLWAVADGMGGHEAGDVASQLIVSALDTISAVDSANRLLEETESPIVLANRHIIEMSRRRGASALGAT